MKLVAETLRMYPPAMIILRQAKEEYTFSGTNVTIPAKQSVWVSISGIQRDATIFPQPEVFDPERFDQENVKSRHPMYYMPFGNGPRNCIGSWMRYHERESEFWICFLIKLGERFAVYQVKCGLVEVLKRYRVDVNKQTMIPYVIRNNSSVMTPKHDIWLQLVKREWFHSIFATCLSSYKCTYCKKVYINIVFYRRFTIGINQKHTCYPLCSAIFSSLSITK